MHKTCAEAREFAGALVRLIDDDTVEVVLAPPFPALAAVAETVRGSHISVAAQDMHWADAGAFTGEVSPLMVKELASHVILGHSERRAQFGDTDATVNQKVHAALAHQLVPIVCVGETEAERDAGSTDSVVAQQLAGSLAALLSDRAADLIVAYEPVWAIGTGRACEAEEAGRVAALVRGWCAAEWSPAVAERVRVVYGGSVTSANAWELFARPEIDGGLVGGASLDAAAFDVIIAAARVP